MPLAAISDPLGSNSMEGLPSYITNGDVHMVLQDCKYFLAWCKKTWIFSRIHA
ncbi:hypothetical protein Nmel_010751, partial [Mimus melanotis]